jgi:hypothetical protein
LIEQDLAIGANEMKINGDELVELLSDEPQCKAKWMQHDDEYDGLAYIDIDGMGGWAHLLWTGHAQLFEILDGNDGVFFPGCTIDVDEILDIVL